MEKTNNSNTSKEYPRIILLSFNGNFEDYQFELIVNDIGVLVTPDKCSDGCSISCGTKRELKDVNKFNNEINEYIQHALNNKFFLDDEKFAPLEISGFDITENKIPVQIFCCDENEYSIGIDMFVCGAYLGFHYDICEEVFSYAYDKANSGYLEPLIKEVSAFITKIFDEVFSNESTDE